ncbi:MAG: hypothetical protein OEW89_10735 [Gammaproteobacteria bacterium]|nr:hypothetical protein [Gammaproteobacteria bacterium]MDH5594866.1 hypothetical protein [Gammaproteobacteria bacterium]
MGEIVKFNKPSAAQKNKGKTLCKRGFHKWEILQEKKFDVKQGKLVTVYQCTRCGKTKTNLV